MALRAAAVVTSGRTIRLPFPPPSLPLPYFELLRDNRLGLPPSSPPEEVRDRVLEIPPLEKKGGQEGKRMSVNAPPPPPPPQNLGLGSVMNGGNLFPPPPPPHSTLLPLLRRRAGKKRNC